MSIISLIKTALYSLRSHKLRAFLTMIGIIIGISSVVTILSIGNGLKAEVLSSAEDTSANKVNMYFQAENIGADTSLIEPFNKDDIYNIQRIQGVQQVEAAQGILAGLNFITSEASYFDKRNFIMLNSYKDKKLNIEYGRNFRDGEEDKKLIVLDKNVTKELFGSPENALGKAITIGGYNYEVIGTLAEAGMLSLDGGSSYISEEAKKSMTSESAINAIDIYIKPNEDKESVLEDIKKELKSSHPNIQGTYEVQDPQAITKAFEKIIDGLTTFIALVTGISLFVGGIGVMNIMYVSVTERKREIGIRRAIGAKPKSIMLQFLFEAIIVTGTGGLIGIGFGYIVSRIVGAFLPFTPVLTVSSFIGATLTSVIVGIIFGIIPAYNASKLDPIKAIYM